MRRFLLVSKSLLSKALKYNLDPRRLGIDKLVLKQKINFYVDAEYHVLLVVNVMTQTPYEDYSYPSRNTDYYIEYIIYFE